MTGIKSGTFNEFQEFNDCKLRPSVCGDSDVHNHFCKLYCKDWDEGKWDYRVDNVFSMCGIILRIICLSLLTYLYIHKKLSLSFMKCSS